MKTGRLRSMLDITERYSSPRWFFFFFTIKHRKLYSKPDHTFSYKTRGKK